MHCMLDLETLSTNGNAAIIEIAAVAFEPVPHGKVAIDRAFQTMVALEGQQHFRSIDPGALAFWLKQPDETRLRIADGIVGGVSLNDALVGFISWFESKQLTHVWSHGVGFDVAIMETAFDALALKEPWHYRNTRDTRTLFSMYQEADQDVVADRMTQLRPDFQEHSALDDCILQAVQLVGALAKGPK